PPLPVRGLIFRYSSFLARVPRLARQAFFSGFSFFTLNEKSGVPPLPDGNVCPRQTAPQNPLLYRALN
ncbi:MAG: hypothetical protein IIY78_10345, partial [Clostridia bacterium]|nr:hypothetical protein [Clostridia bacterium]